MTNCYFSFLCYSRCVGQRCRNSCSATESWLNLSVQCLQWPKVPPALTTQTRPCLPFWTMPSTASSPGIPCLMPSAQSLVLFYSSRIPLILTLSPLTLLLFSAAVRSVNYFHTFSTQNTPNRITFPSAARPLLHCIFHVNSALSGTQGGGWGLLSQGRGPCLSPPCSAIPEEHDTIELSFKVYRNSELKFMWVCPVRKILNPRNYTGASFYNQGLIILVLWLLM